MNDQKKIGIAQVVIGLAGTGLACFAGYKFGGIWGEGLARIILNWND